MSLELLHQILTQKHSVNAILDQKATIVDVGTAQLQTLRALTGEDREYADVEIGLWEALLAALDSAERDNEANEAPLMLGNAPQNTPSTALPQ